MNRTLVATLSRVQAGDPMKVLLRLDPDRRLDELQASVYGMVTDRHLDAKPGERFPGEPVYDSVQIPIPAYMSEHRFAVVLALPDRAAAAELRELLETAEHMLGERYSDAARPEGGERA